VTTCTISESLEISVVFGEEYRFFFTSLSVSVSSVTSVVNTLICSIVYPTSLQYAVLHAQSERSSTTSGSV
jgi:hypothetical protein